MSEPTVLISPHAIGMALEGESAALREQLAGGALSTEQQASVLAAATAPSLTFRLLAVVDGIATVRRGLIGPAVGLLHPAGDDIGSAQEILLARSGAELIHTILSGLGLGPRAGDGPSTEVALSDADDGFAIALGTVGLPPSIYPPTGRSIRWWSLGFGLDGVQPITVVDAASLWRQCGARLVPTDALTIWQELAEVLALVSSFDPDDPPDAGAEAGADEHAPPDPR